jgi:hypothetical protein
LTREQDASALTESERQHWTSLICRINKSLK